MNSLLKHILTDSLRKEKLLSFLRDNPNLFDETLKIALRNDEPQSWRAAWLIGHLITKNDKRIKPHIKSILKVIKEKEDGHQRELLKILIKMNLSEKQEGILFDKCISIWEDINKSPSVRGFAFLIITNTVKKYPELISEIGFLTQEHYTATLSPGIRHSVIKIIKGLKINI